MTIAALTGFFMWCTLLNGSLLLFWSAMVMLFPDLTYRLQRRWFPLSREQFDLLIYLFLGLFKILFIVFSLVPYLALMIIA
ncbi:MAG: hypothetical protein KDI68_03345 [Gammaproteobacteria bacterium]|nr:hypothetical protein [Gammaproteobacteria bacterium]